MAKKLDPRRVSLRRMHFTATGDVKKSVSPAGAARLRDQGLHTYLCPVCGNTHASPKYKPAAP